MTQESEGRRDLAATKGVSAIGAGATPCPPGITFAVSLHGRHRRETNQPPRRRQRRHVNLYGQRRRRKRNLGQHQAALLQRCVNLFFLSSTMPSSLPNLFLNPHSRPLSLHLKPPTAPIVFHTDPPRLTLFPLCPASHPLISHIPSHLSLRVTCKILTSLLYFLSQDHRRVRAFVRVCALCVTLVVALLLSYTAGA